jgi:hypothetical protein
MPKEGRKTEGKREKIVKEGKRRVEGSWLEKSGKW